MGAVVPELSVKVETARLNAAFSQLAIATGKSFGSIVLQNSRLIAWNLAHNSQPYGMTLAEKKTGEAAVARDIGNVFKSAAAIFELLKAEDEKLAKSWYALVKQGGYGQAEKLLREKSKITDRNAPIFAPLDPRFHDNARGRGGRVNRHRAAQIVPDGKSIKSYIKEVQQRVGFGKAGWITAGNQIGRVTRVPGWITRHGGRAPGSAIDNTKGIDPHVTLINGVSYIGSILPPHEIASALNMQREKMLSHIEHVIAAEAEKAGFHFTGNRGTPMAAAA